MELFPLVYILVLNRNGRDHLEYSLPDILRTDYPNFRVVLVDNCSDDDSLEYVRREHPRVEVLRVERNKGWAGGNNAGIRLAKERGARYAVLANNDIKVHPQWVASAVQAFRSDPHIAFVGCRVFGDIRAVPVEEYEQACAQWKEIRFEVTDRYIDGMALFADTVVFDKIGLIDEDYFIYCEETDLEIRAQKAGFKRAVTNVPVWHYSRGYFRQMTLKAGYLAIRNNMRLAIKQRPLTGIFRAILREYYVACWPFFKGDMTKVTTLRSRPRHWTVNFFIVTYCLLWNILNLPLTLKRKNYENNLIKEYLKAGYA